MARSPITVFSLKDSLRNGQIEALRLGTPLLEIADFLGPPKTWITNAYAEPVPLYWFYPGGLELSFEPERPYPLTGFKLSPVGAHRGSITRFNYYFRMRNDFSMIGSSVSDFLRGDIWDLEKVLVGVCADPRCPVLDISVGDLRIAFRMRMKMEDGLEGYLARLDLSVGARIVLLNRNCHFVGAYFSRDELGLSRFPSTGWTTISANEYLHLLEQTA